MSSSFDAGQVEVKTEAASEEHDQTISSIDSDMSKRLSFVETKDAMNNLNQSINISSMKAFLTKVKHRAAHLTPEQELELLLLTVTCIDLTTLAGDDTSSNVKHLCYRAVHPLDDQTMPEYNYISCGAVCVYPSRVPDCVNTFTRIGATSRVNIAAVAAGFPSGQYGIKTRLAEVEEAVENGADEIDVVVNRPAALAGNWPLLFEELFEMRKACDIRKAQGHDVHLKVIIGAGDLLMSTPNTIYLAGLVSIFAGADFIKTSTGKETVNATLSISYVMMRAIIDYYNLTGIRIGFKPAGGIRTYQDALNWLTLVKMMLGPDWLNNKMFRFGASGLLDSVEKRILVLSKMIKRQASQDW